MGLEDWVLWIVTVFSLLGLGKCVLERTLQGWKADQLYRQLHTGFPRELGVSYGNVRD